MNKENRWTIHKFGGTSLATSERFRMIGEILDDCLLDGCHCVVVSALGGITDELLRAIDGIISGDSSYEEVFAGIRKRHHQVANDVLPENASRAFMGQFDSDQDNIVNVAKEMGKGGALPDRIRCVLAGYGELWSASLMQGMLDVRWPERDVVRVDAREVIVVGGDSDSGAEIQWSRSHELLDARVARNFLGTLVVTGYIAGHIDGEATTLGRNGSDFSASIMACLLNAREVTIWTDVNGMMTADPRSVSDVQVIPELSYNEAIELAYFGAKVLHPKTMAPVISRNIPIYIRNTFAPEKPGTHIKAESGGGQPVKGITSIDGIAIVNVEGTGMIDVPGTALRLFGALAEEKISVILVSQGCSEHSICVAIQAGDADKAKAAVESTFAAELVSQGIQRVVVTRDLSILAVVGDKMNGRIGLVAKVFGSLGHAGVNVRAIAQGASERNISAVIDTENASRAVQSVHASFYSSPQTLSIGVIGCGTVGRPLLEQLASQISRLSSQLNLDLRVRGLASSRTMLLGDPQLELAHWAERLPADGEPTDIDSFTRYVNAEHLPHAVIVDCTADRGIANRYGDWLRAGVHVVTPNKKACSSDYQSYCELQKICAGSTSRFLYETTVGAGLPIIQTARDLWKTGDAIQNIRGILSGTIAYLFNQYDGIRPFSEVVKEAHRSGYTEPDPRVDLSGADVACKLVILAREIGLPMEMNQVEIENLVPQALSEVSIDEFWDTLPDYDDGMKNRFDRATAKGEVLRYIAHLDEKGRASASLVSVPAQHAFGCIRLTDNIVQFETRRYSENPLIIQGPGAGPDVTAAGVFADLLRLSTYLGASV